MSRPVESAVHSIRAADVPAGKPLRLFLSGVVVIVLAIAGFALLSEAFASGGQTVYLANIDPGGKSIPVKPSLLVTGAGRASAPAEQAVIQLLIVRNRPYSPNFVTVVPTSSSDRDGSLEPVVEAIMSTGIVSSAIDVVSSPSLISVCNNSSQCSAARINITVARPTLDRLNQIVDAAGAAAGEQGLTVQDVGVGYTVADCRPIQAAAREAAVKDGQSRAEDQARVMGVSLGELLVSNEPAPNEPLDANGCVPLHGKTDDAWWTPGSIGLTVPPFDPEATPEVAVDLEVSLAYAIVAAPAGSNPTPTAH
jgi:uncharacterized protein YggE